MEQLVVSEISGLTTVYDFENLQVLTTYKDNLEPQAKSLCCVKNDYIMWANSSKPTLAVFEATRTAQQPRKKVMPGKVLCACVDDDFLCCGVGENVLLWNLMSGDLIANMSKHYRPINNVQIVNSSCVVASGMDGLISVWSIKKMLSSGEVVHRIPESSFHVFTEVSAMCCSPSLKIYASDNDKVLKVIDIVKKEIISTLSFDVQVTSLCIDKNDTALLVGCSSGKICEVDLAALFNDHTLKANTMVDMTMESVNEFKSWKAEGHGGLVCFLAIDLSGDIFVSGSCDCTFKIWSLGSVSCTKTIQLKSAVCSLSLSKFCASVFTLKKRASFDLPTNFLSSDVDDLDIEKIVDYTEASKKVDTD